MKKDPFWTRPTDRPDLPPVGHGTVSLSNVQDKTGRPVHPNVPILATFEVCRGSTGVYAKCPYVDICPKVDICPYSMFFLMFPRGRRMLHDVFPPCGRSVIVMPNACFARLSS